MLNIHTPLRWFRLTIQRPFRLNRETSDISPTEAEAIPPAFFQDLNLDQLLDAITGSLHWRK
jgi:hypothetical protein